MSGQLPDMHRYEAALREHGAHPIKVEMTVLQLTMLVSSLQLALRHPQYPESMRFYVDAFIDNAIINMERLSPVIAQVMAAGNDENQDVT